MLVARIAGMQVNLQWTAMQGKGGNWIAVCEPLKLTVQSETFGELSEVITDTLDGVLKDLLASNELDRFLSEHGWKLAGATPIYALRPEYVRFDVPFELVMARAGADDPQRSVHQ